MNNLVCCDRAITFAHMHSNYAMLSPHTCVKKSIYVIREAYSNWSSKMLMGFQISFNLNHVTFFVIV